jgi:hypothetical protein
MPHPAHTPPFEKRGLGGGFMVDALSLISPTDYYISTQMLKMKNLPHVDI